MIKPNSNALCSLVISCLWLGQHVSTSFQIFPVRRALTAPLSWLYSTTTTTTTGTTTTSTNKLAEMATPTTTSQNKPSEPTYSEERLKAALDSLLADSENPDFDGRHLYGRGDPNHKLSKLQEVTATVILDYERYLAQPNVAPSIPDLQEAYEGFCAAHGNILNLQTVIQSQAPRMALAAEFKRASPSKGALASTNIVAATQGVKYAKGGANVISILTEPRWFRGSLQDLTDIRLATDGSMDVDEAGIPKNNRNNKNNFSSNNDIHRPAILRKDFCYSDYMIAEAAAAGADSVLLIVAVLPQHLLTRLIATARSYGMEPLVEVHALEELDVALQAGAKVIGVNNRNLHTFQMDLATSERVAAELTARGISFQHTAESPDLTLCALSGMSTALDVDRYRQAGLGMCLIGESLMRATDPEAAIKSLCLHPDDFAQQQQQQTAGGGGSGAYTAGTQLVKVCGITTVPDAIAACQAGANLIGIIFAEGSKRKVSTEQAKRIVQTVRRFGERESTIDWSPYMPQQQQQSNSGPLSPLLQLVRNANTLVSTATQQRPAVVGVFQNQDPEYIRQMVQECGLDLVQLHGSEGMAAAAATNYGVPAIRVVDIEVDPATGTTSSTAVDTILQTITTDPIAILLDTSIKGKSSGGGTGQAFDWKIAEQIQAAGLPVIIAGGLTAESVQECVGSTRPFGVDVSSGVEVAPGLKDTDKVHRFVQGARQAAQEASKGF